MLPPAGLRMGASEWALLVFLSLLWGGTFVLARIAVAEIGPLTVAWARVVVAAAVLALVMLASRQGFPAGWRGWAPFLGMGLLNNVVPFSLIFWGQTEIGAGLAAVLNATTPLFGGVLAHFLTDDERLTANRLAGLLIGIAGVAVLVGPALPMGGGGRLAGSLAVLGAAASYGLAGIYGRRFRGTPALTSACCQLTCSSLLLAPLSLGLDQPWLRPLPGPAAMLAVLAIAVLCTALAYVVFFTILKRAGASNVMLVTLLIPPSAIAMGAAFLGERLEAVEVAGAGLIGLALLVIDGRVLRFMAGSSGS